MAKHFLTSKQVTPLQMYILNAIDGDCYEVELTDNLSKVNFVLDCFKSEYLHKNNIAQYNHNKAKVFGEWLSGLPSSINIDFYNHKILEIGYLFDFLSANATEEQEDNFLNLWFRLVAKEFFNLHRILNAKQAVKNL